MSQTTMGEALSKANYKSPADILQDIIIECVGRYRPERFHEAYQDVWYRVSKNRDLLEALIGDEWSSLVARRVSRTMKHARRVVASGRGNVAMAAAVRVQDDFDEKLSEQRAELEERHWIAMAPEREKVARAFSAAFDGFAAKKIEEYKKSCLFNFAVNGRPVGEQSSSELADWASAQSEHVEFVHLVISGINPADRRPIKEIVDPREANEMWFRAHGNAWVEVT